MSKRPKYADIEVVRLGVEQAWAYDRHLEHLSYREMRARALEQPERGGLGYDLSEHALAGLVRGYLATMRETLTEQRDAYVSRELADLDTQQRALTSVLARNIDTTETARVARDLGYGSTLALLEAEPEAAVPLPAGDLVRLLAALRAVGESRRKLLGLDAPIEAKVDITHRSAVEDELAAMLADVGNKSPEKVKAKQ
jgi:hypothetical protein